MTNRKLKSLIIASLVFMLFKGTPAQDPVSQPTTQPTSSALETTIKPAQITQAAVRNYGRVSVNAARGVSVSLGNRTTGRITVNGWDRDVIEAHALSQRGDEVVRFDQSGDPASKRFSFKADYAALDQPAALTNLVEAPPQLDGRSVKVHLEINVPRYAEIELIQVWRSDVQVSGVETPISVSSDQSSIVLKRVGAAAVRTRSGNVEIEEANGLVEVATTSGAVRVHEAKGAVHVVSIAGPIEIKCARGRIDVANTEAPIDLVNIDGDVDAIATNSSVRYTGNLRQDGRYYLKSMSGRVEMMLPANTAGFYASLTSYRGLVESDFKLSTKQSAAEGPFNRRLVGRFGNGKAQIMLDSFEGLVRLTRVARESLANCQ